MATVHTSVEGKRGCGYRKGGGIYLVSGALSEPCPKLPIELHVCPTCGAGVKQTRGFTWILPDPLLDPGAHGAKEHDDVCPLGQHYTDEKWKHGERAGLIWIGAAYYPTPDAFMKEAGEMGVSRRISAVPRDFKVGETWIALAHPKAVAGECEHGAPADNICTKCDHGRSAGEWRGGVVTFFRPTSIEYVVKGDETEEELDRLDERGFKLVRVVRSGEQAELEDDTEEEAA